MRLALEIDPDSQPISGRLCQSAGAEIAFTGLLELLPLIERVRRGEPLGAAGDEEPARSSLAPNST